MLLTAVPNPRAQFRTDSSSAVRMRAALGELTKYLSSPRFFLNARVGLGAHTTSSGEAWAEVWGRDDLELPVVMFSNQHSLIDILEDLALVVVAFGGQ